MEYPPERFWSKVEFGEHWLWRGRTHPMSGYGTYSRSQAHRVAYEFCVGPIPDGLVIDHLCRIRHCVHPDHLEAVTHQENCRRGLNNNESYARINRL